MTNLRSVAALALALVCFASPLAADSTAATPAAHSTVRVGDLVIEGGWTREPPPGASVAGGYMTITNTGDASDTLVGGSAPFAERFEVHEMAVEDGMMRMAPVPGGLLIPAGESVMLQPGGYHVMFMGITDAPAAGETASVTLRFEKAGEVTLTLPVATMGAQSFPEHGNH